jgi:hypothetical protein
MQPQIATVLLKALAAAADAPELPLRVGSEVVVRVVQAPQDGGRGLVSLAGRLLEARLPAGVAAGSTLPVKVVDASPEQIVLRVRDDAQPREPDHLGHAAGALAVSGEPQLVRAADALAPPGLALPLPNGDALELRVDPDETPEERPGGRERGAAEAGFVLHSAELGPIEVRVRLDGSTVVAGVSVDERALAEAREALPSLTAALARVSGAVPRVTVAARTPGAEAPAAPRVAEGLDAYA